MACIDAAEYKQGASTIFWIILELAGTIYVVALAILLLHWLRKRRRASDFSQSKRHDRLPADTSEALPRPDVEAARARLASLMSGHASSPPPDDRSVLDQVVHLPLPKRKGRAVPERGQSREP
jgi:hypothetical protein